MFLWHYPVTINRQNKFCGGLGDRLDTLPMGINTPIYKNFDERGIEPSGGEEQKIVLARALYKDTPIIILDEPTSALDPRAEFEIYQHFNELSPVKQPFIFLIGSPVPDSAIKSLFLTKAVL